MTAYYNEIDPKQAARLRWLIDRNLIAPGDVDERSIEDVRPEDVREYTQCHWFAGIGGWSLALRYAGWPDDRPVWTGSCPCQPFSAAGKRKGARDKRHLWPVWLEIIKAARPQIIFGEQVASAEVVGSQQEAAFIGAVRRGDYAKANTIAKRLAKSRSFHYHKRWLDGVRADVEAAGYAFEPTVLGAHSVGAPHKRQRVWWVADAGLQRRQAGRAERAGDRSAPDIHDQRRSAHGGLGQPDGSGPQQGRVATEAMGYGSATEPAGGADGIPDGFNPRPPRSGSGTQPGGAQLEPGDDYRKAWGDFEIIRFADGKTRRIESGLMPLAHGVPERLVRISGYGNAIVPQVAARFIEAYMSL